AQSLGFRVQERRYLRTLQFTFVRLRPPRNMSARVALARLRQADPKGFYDHNQVYRLASGEGAGSCTGVRCFGQDLIGWGDSRCAIKPRLGLVDSALDRDHPA